LEYRLQGKVTKLVDGCYAGEEGLYELKNRVEYARSETNQKD
jgi:peptide subunit release factor 1 (eRF1)